MAAVLSILVFDDAALDGKGDVYTTHLRPDLPCADAMAVAAHLTVMAHQLTRGAPLVPLPGNGNEAIRSVFDPAHANLVPPLRPTPPPPAEAARPTPPPRAAEGRARGKG